MRVQAMPTDEMLSILQERLSEIAPWEGNGSLRHRYPVTKPAGEVVRAIAEFWDRNTNNVGAHLEEPVDLRGTRRLEREVIRDLACLFGCADADGWLTTGGTEGNITALWMARERLCALGESSPPVFCTRLTHDSIFKACRILGLGRPTEVPLTSSAVMDTDALKHLAREAITRGADGLIVVANVGATLTGTCDSVPGIAAAIPEEVASHLHVDAAFAGLVLPFSDPGRAIDFSVPEVDSIVVDLHKMGQIPLGVGAFLCRPGYASVLQNESTYAHVQDCTLLGSRPGAMAAAAWIGMNKLGRNGFRQTVEYCLRLKARFLKKVPSDLVVHDPAVNVVAVLGDDPRDRIAGAYRIYFMPHLHEEDVDKLTAQILRTVKRTDGSETERTGHT